MPPPLSQRIRSIDLLKGLVMVVMALDHTRDYFHAPAFLYEPGDPVHSTLPIFFTRFVTHYCAPVFSLLAGVSAFLSGRKLSKRALSFFLLKRGFWLVFMELTVVGFGWYFDVHFRNVDLLVIWSLGISMLALAGLIHLPPRVLLAVCLVVLFGHNLLDGVHFNGFLWGMLHEPKTFAFYGHTFFTGYPVLPWIAVMGLGYYLGRFYSADGDARQRRRLFNGIGVGAVVLFVILRLTNVYGDPAPFVRDPSMGANLISFFNPTKYPPSLCFLLMTLGPAFLFLANLESVRGRMVDVFSTFGRVPFFYYILHIYLLHGLACLFAELSGFGWQHYVLKAWPPDNPELRGSGYPLWVVYLVWAVVVVSLYPFCKWFDGYKQRNKGKWWLSYL